MLSLTKQWAETDPETAGQWLQGLPADASRAAVVEAYIDSTLAARPDLAAAWVSSISDETKRNRSIQNVARRWFQKDPQAAQTWLQGLGPAD